MLFSWLTDENRTTRANRTASISALKVYGDPPLFIGGQPSTDGAAVTLDIRDALVEF